jgi:alpha-ketoglutaric semialdehyde dehydrogenase
VSALRSYDPCAPSELILELAEPSAAEVLDRLERSLAAWDGWRADAPGRAAALTAFADGVAARADAFVELMAREVGKPVAEAEGEVARAVAILRYYGQAALDADGETYPGSIPGSTVLVSREPLGAVLAVCPWNFPLAIPVWKAAPALAYGNVVLLKPASPAIGVGDLLGQAAAESLPPDVLSPIPLSGARTAELLDDERIAAVTFTGSTEVGLAVAERLARRAAPAQAEMGGQNPAIVLEDADAERAADAIVSGAMSYAGQKCTATRRAIAVGEVAEPLAEAMAQRVQSLVVGHPSAENVTVGPLIDARAVEEFEARCSAALEAGAAELARAEAPAGEPGHFVSPLLLGEDDPMAEVNREETFGPLLTLLRVGDEAGAIEAANSTRFGLVGAVHGRDLGRAVAVAGQLDCGMRRINAPTPGVDYYAPFGGERSSGFGPREQGRAARDFFTSRRTMTIVPGGG